MLEITCYIQLTCPAIFCVTHHVSFCVTCYITCCLETALEDSPTYLYLHHRGLKAYSQRIKTRLFKIISDENLNSLNVYSVKLFTQMLP